LKISGSKTEEKEMGCSFFSGYSLIGGRKHCRAACFGKSRKNLWTALVNGGLAGGDGNPKIQLGGDVSQKSGKKPECTVLSFGISLC